MSGDYNRNMLESGLDKIDFNFLLNNYYNKATPFENDNFEKNLANLQNLEKEMKIYREKIDKIRMFELIFNELNIQLKEEKKKHAEKYVNKFF